MAGGEDQAQQIIANIVVNCIIQIRHGSLTVRLDLAAQFFMFPFQQLVSAKKIGGTVFRRGHQPGPGLVRDAFFWPFLESGYESILREVLGQTDIMHDARKAGNEPRRFDPPDCVDGAMCIERRHRDGQDLDAPWADAPAS